MNASATINEANGWQKLPAVCHRLGVFSDLVRNLGAAGIIPVEWIPFEGDQAQTLSLKVGSLNDEQLMDAISSAFEIVHGSGEEPRPDEAIVHAIEERLAGLRGNSLGEGLKRRANEKLYGYLEGNVSRGIPNGIRYGVRLLKDRLVVGTKHFVEDIIDLNWVHFFPNEEKPRARPHESLRAALNRVIPRP